MLEFKLTLFFLLLFTGVYSQESFVIEKTFDWNVEDYVEDLVEATSGERISFDLAVHAGETPLLPIYSQRFPVAAGGTLKVEILESDFLDASPLLNELKNKAEFLAELKTQLSEDIVISTNVDQNRNQYYGKVFFTPITYSGGQIAFLKSVKLKVTHKKELAVVQKSPLKLNSVLREGEIYKLKLSNSGMYKMTGAYLQDVLSINLSSIDPSKIQIFTNPGGKLPFAIIEERVDDLLELNIMVVGGDDGVFSSDDALIFYAEGAEKWSFSEGSEYMEYNDNPFDVDNYVFLRLGVEAGKRIVSQGENVLDVTTINSYLHADRYELNETNLLEDNFGTLGTGQEWFGEYFEQNPVRDFTSKLNITNIIPEEEAQVKLRFAGRSSSSTSVKLNIDGKNMSKSIGSVLLSSYSSDFARISTLTETFQLSNNSPNISIDYTNNSNASGWLDYIQIQYKRQLSVTSEQLVFNNLQSGGNSQYNFLISNAGPSFQVWNISNFDGTFRQNTIDAGSTNSFTGNSTEFQKYAVFNPSANLYTPSFIAKIPNQNLHNIQDFDLVIVTHPSLMSEAERLKEHRESHSGIDIRIVTITEVFNEFSSGRMEPTAVRDFFKMILDRDPEFKYGLLIGNGSYDYKGILHDRDQFNLVPVFETAESMNAISDFPSDDFYGLLSSSDGGDLKGEVDLAIGRIPVGNLQQARTVVDKIIKYDTDPSVRGSWNIRSIFVADDEDGNIHIDPADDISEDLYVTKKDINSTKIYFDSYPQVSTPGGERYPTVTDEINSAIFNGSITLCYLGHGGPTGWSQERVLQLNDIDSWKNDRSYPLFITATCSLASYDDPEIFSAGEKILVSKNGGIGLFTTSRAVYANDNTRLTTSVFDFMFESENGQPLPIGEILRRSKNATAQDTVDVNARKFLLLGDPSMSLLNPMYDVVTSTINGVDLSQTAFTDTIKALSKMSISGFVAENTEKLSNFNGTITVTVFDKRSKRKTLEQDPRSNPKDFLVQKNLIFKGNAKVTNGEFDLEFVVPKDILYTVGNAKISYYATDGVRDAKGNFRDFLVGGSSSNPVEDDTPPLVEVFMNNEEFVFGGLTNDEPVLYAKISDDIGINLSGASVGHDLTGKLDENSQKTYLLNDFFESELNNFSKGIVKYPLNKLENGQHTITVRAWDVANNVGEGYTEFIVSDNAGEGLAHVLNYPNPFTDNTCFMFEHNMAPDVMDVQINIFTASGKLVKTIDHNTVSDGYRINDIKWDGNDDFGSPLARGVYLYKIKVRAQQQNLQKESGYEKLVLLK